MNPSQNNPTEYSETFSGTNSKMLTTAFLLVIIVGAIGLYYAMKPRILEAQMPSIVKPSKEVTPQITGHVTNNEAITPFVSNISKEGLEIIFNELKVCDYFDEDICSENKEKQITRGNSFYIYEEILSTNKNTRTQVFQQSLKIEDEYGKVLYENSNYDEFVIGRGANITIPVKIILYTFESDPVRKEIITLTFKNKYSGEKIEKTLTYELI